MNKYFRDVNQAYTLASSWSSSDNGIADTVVPTAADDVFFTASSGNCTSITGGAAKSLNFTGYTKTLTWTTGQLNVSGNITLSPAMTLIAGTNNMFNILASCIFTSNGKYVPGIININSTATITLADTLNVNRIVLSANSIWAGTVGFNTDSLEILGGLEHIFTFPNTYKIGTFRNTYSTGSAHTIIRCDLIFPIPLYATGECNIGFTDFTYVDASLGRPLYSFNGVVMDCINVFTMTDYVPPVSSTTFSCYIT